MARMKLNMSKEERRLYNNKMHREQTRRRREKAKREAYRQIVQSVVDGFEVLGWNQTELIVGVDEQMVDAVVDKLIKEDKFKITLGSKIGVRIKEKGE